MGAAYRPDGIYVSLVTDGLRTFRVGTHRAQKTPRQVASQATRPVEVFRYRKPSELKANKKNSSAFIRHVSKDSKNTVSIPFCVFQGEIQFVADITQCRAKRHFSAEGAAEANILKNMNVDFRRCQQRARDWIRQMHALRSNQALCARSKRKGLYLCLFAFFSLLFRTLNVLLPICFSQSCIALRLRHLDLPVKNSFLYTTELYVLFYLKRFRSFV